MDLQLAAQWLARDVVGFSEIHQFAEQCRTGAAAAGRESAALILLALAAATFAERQEGVAVSQQTVVAFLRELRSHAQRLSMASGESDSALLEQINRFAALESNEMLV